MCGRATLTVDTAEIAEMFGAEPIEIGAPKYNLAPTSPMVIVRPGPDQKKEMAVVRWGLVPWWATADEAKRIASRCINARIESVARSPAFRDAFRARRCLVVIDGFYEWKKTDAGDRRPHHVRREDRRPFAIAGVWESWRSPDGELLESCAVVTTEAKGSVAELHDRMPIVVPPNAWDAWLGGSTDEAARIVAATTDLVTVPVSRWVNDVRHDDPRCLEPEMPTPELGQIALRFS